MRISAVSNKAFNTTGMGLRVNKHLSPLEKQKHQLQEQIKNIEESKSSKESKKNSINELQKKLEEVGEQLAKEKLDKPNEEIEVIKKDKEVENEKATGESEENSQVINKDVVIGITSASYHNNMGKVAYSVYKGAVTRGDMATAERALSYTKSEIKKSAEGRNLMERGISTYKKQMENVKNANSKKLVFDKVVGESDVNSKGRGTIAKDIDGSNTTRVEASRNIETKFNIIA